MQSTYHLTLRSSNSKTGPIPVSTTSSDTCPDACPLKNKGCYAAQGHLAIHWRKVSDGKRGEFLNAFLAQIKSLPAGTFWRHNQAGDLPGNGDSIDQIALNRLVDANKGKRGFTYTHKPPTGSNRVAIKSANRAGFTVNLSANSIHHADELVSKRIAPVVTILPSNTRERSIKTPAGNTVVVCPATRVDGMTCDKCRLCAKADRPFIIGFPAHGSKSAQIDSILSK